MRYTALAVMLHAVRLGDERRADVQMPFAARGLGTTCARHRWRTFCGETKCSGVFLTIRKWSVGGVGTSRAILASDGGAHVFFFYLPPFSHVWRKTESHLVQFRA